MEELLAALASPVTRAVIMGAIQGAPALVSSITSVAEAFENGSDPTADQLAALDAATTDVHNRLQAAAPPG